MQGLVRTRSRCTWSCLKVILKLDVATAVSLGDICTGRWQQLMAGSRNMLEPCAASDLYKGSGAPVFFHPGRRLVTSVHGDDLTTAGPKQSLDWYEAELSNAYELSTGGRLGPGDTDCKEGTVLNRVIRWCSSGLEYEADPRQAEKL